MDSKKRKALSGIFIFIYVVLTLVLVYLLFFNTGLEIKEELNPFTGVKEVFVVNATDRVINSIRISYSADGRTGDLNGFAELAPKEKRAIDLGSIGAKKVSIEVQAPFHLPLTRLIDLNPQAGQPVKIEIPGSAQLGAPFDFSVSLCNNGDSDTPVQVEELHEPVFFFSPNNTNSLTLKPNECQVLKYTLSPGKAGDTTIYFNVNFPNNNQQFQKAVTVHG